MEFDIQYFANEVQTTEALSAEMKTFYDMTLLDEAGANLIHDQFGHEKKWNKSLIRFFANKKSFFRKQARKYGISI